MVNKKCNYFIFGFVGKYVLFYELIDLKVYLYGSKNNMLYNKFNWSIYLLNYEIKIVIIFI